MDQTITHKTCNVCNVSKLLSDFYREKRGKLGVKPDCKQCYEKKPNRDLKVRRDYAQFTKIKLVNYLGGECIKCGYNLPEGIDFHHLDPSKKDFEISRRKGALSNEKVRKELQKCAPLCRNCHAEFHFGRFDLEPYLHKIPKFNENTEKQNPIGDELILGLQISFVD